MSLLSRLLQPTRLAAPLMYRERARLPLDDYPHLLAWFDRVRELPAWRNSEAVW